MSSPENFFRNRFQEEKESVRNIDTINKDVHSFIELKKIIDSVDFNHDYNNSQKNEILSSLQEDMQSLIDSTIAYVKAADAQEHYAQFQRRDITEESKNKLISLDEDRTATHNSLIADLNKIEFDFKALSIDNKLLRDIIGIERKLDIKSQDDRRVVERWARNVADYLATVSETTSS